MNSDWVNTKTTFIPFNNITSLTISPRVPIQQEALIWSSASTTMIVNSFTFSGYSATFSVIPNTKFTITFSNTTSGFVIITF